MNDMPRLKASVGLAGALFLGACVGQIESGAGASRRSSDPADDERTAAATPPPGFEAVASPMRRLTTTEYANSIQFLTGEKVSTPIEAIDYDTYDFSSVGAGFVTLSEQGIEQFNAAAQAVAQRALATSEGVSRIVGCTPTSAEDPCIEAFVKRFGRLAWRRALEADEVTRYTGLVRSNATVMGGVAPAIESVVAGLLSSPNFLFRVELGEKDTTTGVQRFTGYEIASRLSFLLIGTTPDDALLTAAENGALFTPTELAGQASRLLATPAARDALLGFFTEHFGLEGLDSLSKDPAHYTEASATLGQSMRSEIDRTLEDIVFTRNTDFRELFDTKTTFANGEMSSIYGTPASGTDFTKISLPTQGGRAGLLGLAGILALKAHAVLTSPTLRGKFVRERLLCQQVAPPPANVDAVKFMETATTTHVTMRQALEQHATNPTCAGCHKMMDPIGYGLEHFDAVGAYRADDQGLTLNTATDLDGKPFDGPAELGALLRDDPRTAQCIVSKFYTYANGHAPTSGEKVAIDQIQGAFQSSGFRLLALVTETVKAPGFRFVAAPK